VKLYVFDLLYLDGKSLIDSSLMERREFLSALIQDGKLEGIEVAKFIVTGSSEKARGMFQEALELGFEGLMIKNPSSKYTPGKGVLNG